MFGEHTDGRDREMKETVDALTALADASSAEDAARIAAALKKTLGEEAVHFDNLIAVLARRAGELDALRRAAGSDALTGLANRRVFYDAVLRANAEWRRSGTGFAVILFDMDGLKQLNDTHGHAAGDEALRAVASACMATRRTTDLVARIGGDEFAVLLTNTNEAGAHAAGERYRAHVEAQVVRGQHLRVSTGVALPDARAFTADEVIEAADASMYEDKRARKSGVTLPTPSTPPGLAA